MNNVHENFLTPIRNSEYEFVYSYTLCGNRIFFKCKKMCVGKNFRAKKKNTILWRLVMKCTIHTFFPYYNL